MENYQWIAMYEDGTSLKQYNEDGSENLFKDIDQKRLIEFALVTPEKNLSVFPKVGKFGIFSKNGTDISETVVAVTFDFDTFKDADEFRLVYFKRAKKELGQGNNQTHDTNIYNVGLQTTIKNKNYIRLLSLNNGKISIVDRK